MSALDRSGLHNCGRKQVESDREVKGGGLFTQRKYFFLHNFYKSVLR